MTTFTSTLPDDLLEQLNKSAQKMSLPKNKLIEKALRIFLDQLNRAEYVKSYKEAGSDADLMSIAEEGMQDYFTQLEDEV